MRLEDDRYEEIKRTISELYCDYEISAIPISVERLASKMNILLVPYSEFDSEKREALLRASEDGFSFYNSDKKQFSIYYNDSKRTRQRIRFTIMHEIGHIALGHGQSCDRTESEADFFARNALAPLPLLIVNNIRSVEEIAEIFNISFECSKNVYRTLNRRLECGLIGFLDYEIEIITLFCKIKS